MVEVENGGRENHPHRVERAVFARRSRWVPRSTKRPGPLSDLWAPPSIRTNVLLYIGQTDLTFGERIPRENWGGGSIEDPQNLEVYVGRLKGPAAPSRDDWRSEIRLAPPSIRTNVLLYIGQTDLTFGERIPRENWVV